ncbi:serine hydrolase domain-containing protein [Spongiimicrobium salis]|uniref:serine hydrolase domain-containing protein n=1 Tax=Spongiimicrobium salis TaxID=1667022 RepID=UPI00374DB355
MKNKAVIFFYILLFTTTIGFAQLSDALAPEATTAEKQLSFRDIPELEKAFIDTSPASRKDGIPVGNLKKDDELIRLAKEIAEKKHGSYDGLLIAHKNKLVFESYYSRGRVDLAHEQSSAAKGYTSLILGRAIQLGYLSMTDLNKPLISFLKDLDASKLVDGAEKITLHKVLTMRSGIRISEEKRRALEENPSQLKGQGLVQTWLEHSAPITNASQSYLYGPDPALVMQVIEAVVPGTAKDFIKTELLDKLGITNYRWETNISGVPEAGWRVSMTLRDMAKWGMLVLNKGKWNGEQLIPEAFISKATQKITKPTAAWQPKTYAYGYFWYQTDIAVGDKSYNANFAWGGGGQHIIVVEELDLIITITGHDGKDTIMNQVSKNILPVFANLEKQQL